MKKSTEQTKKELAEKRQKEDDRLLEEAKARESSVLITPDKELDEDAQSQSSEQGRFFTLPTHKKKETKEKDEPIVMICGRSGGGAYTCVPVDMDESDARQWCEDRNKLSESQDPNDNAVADNSWALLKQGKEAESIQMLRETPGARSASEKGRESSEVLKPPMTPLTGPVKKINISSATDSRKEEPYSEFNPSPTSTTPKFKP